MRKFKTFLLLAVLQSSSVFAISGLEEKEQEVNMLLGLQKSYPALSIEAYQRELQYEKLEISHEERAKRETNLFVEKIKTQISSLYQTLLEETHSPELASSGVKAKIETDLALIAPELQEEIKTISLNALEAAERGDFSSETSAPAIEADMLKFSIDRSEYLNSGFWSLTKDVKAVEVKKADTTEYKSKKELIASLTSTETSIMGGKLSSNSGISSSKTTTMGGSISYRVKVKFIGVDLNAGPSISFNRAYNTSVSISGDGLKPLQTRSGGFDYFVRDMAGKIVLKDGKPEKRYITFSCNADLSFSTTLNGSGGFSIAGVGGDAFISRNYYNSVSLSSRRVALPEFIEGKTVTIPVLAKLCQTDFMNAKLMNNMTLKSSLNLMMKDVISSLVFSHPKTKCVYDSHCQKWFKKEVLPMLAKTAVAKCLENTTEKYRACYARGTEGAKCPITAKGKLLTNGIGEMPCSSGFVCKQTKEYGWFKNFQVFQYAEGRCSK